MNNCVNKPLLSIIIVSYKNLRVLIDCLDSIDKFNDIGGYLEVLVIDNSPDKNYIFNFISNNYNWVKIIKNSNKGFGQANNIGYENSQGRYLLFLNPDTILVEPIMRFAINKFEENHNLAMFGVKFVNKELKTNCSYFFDYRCGVIYFILIKILNKFNIFISKKMYISGADIFIRREIFKNVGRFDENIFMYGEEPDLTRRIRLYDKSLKICFFRQIKIIHLEGKSSNVSTIALRNRLTSSIYYGKKYNLNIRKKFLGELRYIKLKKFIYTLLNREKINDMEKSIQIFKEYIDLL